MVIRELKADSIEEVFLIINESENHIALPNYYTISSIIQLYGSISYAVLEDDKIVGVSLNCPLIDSNGIFVYLFLIDVNYQRKGLGTNFFIDMCQRLLLKGYYKICLRVLKKNQAALTFWNEMGFCKSGAIFNESDEQYSEYFLEKRL